MRGAAAMNMSRIVRMMVECKRKFMDLFVCRTFLMPPGSSRCSFVWRMVDET